MYYFVLREFIIINGIINIRFGRNPAMQLHIIYTRIYILLVVTDGSFIVFDRIIKYTRR